MNETYLGQDHVIYSIYRGLQTAETVRAVFKDYQKFSLQLRSEGYPVLIFVDTTELTHQDSGARREGMRMLDEIDYDKSAVVGGTFMKHLVNLIMSASGKSIRAKYFSNKAEALAWLTAKQYASK